MRPAPLSHVPRPIPPPLADGSAGLHAMGGMAGAIVVQNASAEDLTNPAAGPVDASFVAVVQTFNLGAGTVRNYRWASWASGSTLPLRLEVGHQPPVITTVNGQVRPVVALGDGRAVLLRIVQASHNDLLLLSLRDRGPAATGAADSTAPRMMVGASGKAHGCALTVVARDGENLRRPREQEAILMAPGSRADVVVRCSVVPNQGVDLVSGDAAVMRASEDYYGNASDVAQGIVLHFVRGGHGAPSVPADATGPGEATPETAAKASGPERDDLCALQLDEASRFDVRMNHGGAVRRPAGPGLNEMASYVHYGMNGEAFNDQPRRIIALGAVEEWHVINDRMDDGSPQRTNHPFHLHQHHFQICRVSAAGGAPGATVDYDLGDWRDTISLPAPGNVTIRWRASDFVGDALARTAPHEDGVSGP